MRTTIYALERILIDLEYAAADCYGRKTSASDHLERADIEILLPKLRAAKLAVQLALDSMQTPSDREISRAACHARQGGPAHSRIRMRRAPATELQRTKSIREPKCSLV